MANKITAGCTVQKLTEYSSRKEKSQVTDRSYVLCKISIQNASFLKGQLRNHFP